MVIRLQCRVTAANKELYEQLENMPEKYRAKRLVELASMMSIMLGAGGFNPILGGPAKTQIADPERQERRRKTYTPSATTHPQLPGSEAQDHAASHSKTVLTPEEKVMGESTSEVNQDDKQNEKITPAPAPAPPPARAPNFAKEAMQLRD